MIATAIDTNASDQGRQHAGEAGSGTQQPRCPRPAHPPGDLVPPAGSTRPHPPGAPARLAWLCRRQRRPDLRRAGTVPHARRFPRRAGWAAGRRAHRPAIDAMRQPIIARLHRSAGGGRRHGRPAAHPARPHHLADRRGTREARPRRDDDSRAHPDRMARQGGPLPRRGRRHPGDSRCRMAGLDPSRTDDLGLLPLRDLVQFRSRLRSLCVARRAPVPAARPRGCAIPCGNRRLRRPAALRTPCAARPHRATLAPVAAHIAVDRHRAARPPARQLRRGIRLPHGNDHPRELHRRLGHRHRRAGDPARAAPWPTTAGLSAPALG